MMTYKQSLRLLYVAFLLVMVLKADAQVQFEETYRLQSHFSPKENWLNDPCGTVYLDGEYHLMYQYNPKGNQWGNMSWGHAMSKDLVHWEELPVALYSDALGQIFSGGAVIDKNNTAGFGENAMVAIFTHAGATQQQSLAYSNDKGRTWAKYSDNPVLKNQGIADFRDPQVFWYEPGSKWIMTLAVKDRIDIFSSPNLKEWSFKSSFGENIGAHGGVWECPDLFPLKVEGTNEEKWVLMVSINPGGPAGGSAIQYFLGDFNGSEFIIDEEFSEALTAIEPSAVAFADFENVNYENWGVTGTAFGVGPATGALPDQQLVQGYLGNYLVNSFHGGDDSQGKLVSANFEISAFFINFLIGGGNRPGEAEIRLIVNNEVVKTATGRNEERLFWQGWDLTEWLGQTARIEILDSATGSWGHLNIDHISLSDRLFENSTIEAFWADYGPDFYAGRSWENIPEQSNQRVWISWMNNWNYAGNIPTFPWRGSMSLPRTISVKQFPEGLRLIQEPVEQLQSLRHSNSNFSDFSIKKANEFINEHKISGKHYEIEMKLVAEPGEEVGIKLLSNGIGYTKVGYKAATNEVFLNRSLSGQLPYGIYTDNLFETSLLTSGASVRVHIYVDHSSVEVFFNEGEKVISSRVFPNNGMNDIEFYQTGSNANILDFNFWSLKSIWEGELTSSQANREPEMQRFKIYPNPSRGNWILDTEVSFTHCKVLNIKSEEMPVSVIKLNPSSFQINTKEPLSDGVYFIKLYENEEHIQTERIIIQ